MGHSYCGPSVQGWPGVQKPSADDGPCLPGRRSYASPEPNSLASQQEHCWWPTGTVQRDYKSRCPLPMRSPSIKQRPAGWCAITTTLHGLPGSNSQGCEKPSPRFSCSMCVPHSSSRHCAIASRLFTGRNARLVMHTGAWAAQKYGGSPVSSLE